MRYPSALLAAAAFAALVDGGSMLSAAFLVVSAVLYLKLRVTGHQWVLGLVTLFAAVGAGNLLPSLILYPSFFPTGEGIVALSFVSVVVRALPLVGFIVAEMSLRLMLPRSSKDNILKILLPAIAFAFVGIVQEHTGAGRSIWWISGSTTLEWTSVYGGPVLVDVLIAILGASLAELILLRRPVELRRLLIPPTDGEAEDSPEDQSETRPKPYRPLLAIAFVALLALAGSYPSYSTFIPTHPSPTDPDYRYPPIKVGCVVPPPRGEHHTRQKHRTERTLDEWIRETQVVASRGAKFISWSEAAVRLEGDPSRRGAGDGWQAMGVHEQALLIKVGAVADQYNVHIAATYVVPAASPAPRHKVYNVVTLVGPSKGAGTPRIVWSTTKHNPVPFVESYANLVRSDASLGSSSDRFPLARIELPHRPHTPSPSLTPLQSIDVSGVICLDIAFPSLVNSYTVPFFSEAQPLSPALIFNPSATPSTLARVQFEQMRARAIEQRTFVLRCDSDTGISGLVAPDGTVRVIRYADEGWNSWETDIDAERGKGRTFFAMLKSEWSVWAMMVGLTLFAALGDYGGGAVARRTMEVARRTLSKFSKLGGSRDERLVDV